MELLQYAGGGRPNKFVRCHPESNYPYGSIASTWPSWTAALAGTALDGSTARSAILKSIICRPAESGYYRGLFQQYLQSVSSARPNALAPWAGTEHYKYLRQWAKPFNLANGLPYDPVDGLLTVTPRTLETQYTTFGTYTGLTGVDYGGYILDFSTPVYLDAAQDYQILIACELFLTARTTPAAEVAYDLQGIRESSPQWGGSSVSQREKYNVYGETLADISAAIGATETEVAPSGNAPTLGMLRRNNAANWKLALATYTDNTTLTSVTAQAWCNRNYLLVRV